MLSYSYYSCMTPEHPEWYIITLKDLQPRAAIRRYRQAIKDEWGRCAYCGRTHGSDGKTLEMTLDHVVPRRWGGDRWARRNIVPSCIRCNRAKGSTRNYLDWWESTPWYCPKRAEKVSAWIAPISTHWTIGEASNVRTNSRTEVCPEKGGAGGKGSVEAGAHRSLAGLLGGEVSVEAELQGVQSGGWACLQVGRAKESVLA